MSRYTSALLCLALYQLSFWLCCATALCQSDASHRWLPPPDNVSLDIQQQFRVLQHLQQLMRQKQPPQAQRESTSSGDMRLPGSNDPGFSRSPLSLDDLAKLTEAVDPRALNEALKTLNPQQRATVERMAKSLVSPEGLSPADLQQLKEQASKLDSPALRDQAREMLRKFEQSRLPSPTPTSTPGELPSSVDSRLPPSSFPSAEQTTPSQSSSHSPSPSRNPSSSYSPSTARGPSPPRSPSSLRSASSTQNSSEVEPSIVPRSTPGDNEPAEVKARDTQPLGSPTPSDRPLPSMADLLKQSQRDPGSLPPLSLPPNLSDDVKSWIGSELANRMNRSKESQLYDQLKRSLPASLQEELRRSGVEQSLRNLVQQQRQSNSSASAPSKSNPTLKQGEQSVAPEIATPENSGWMESVSKRIVPKESVQPNNNASPVVKSDKPSPSLVESIAQYYRRLTTRSNAPAGQGDSSAAAGSSAGSSGGVGKWSLLKFGLGALGFGLLVVLVVVAGRIWNAGGMTAQTPLTSLSFDQLKIRTRADVVRVFHQLATCSGVPIELWWPHPKATLELSTAAPWASAAMCSLERLYEIARYAPESQLLTESQLEQARHAVGQWQAAKREFA